MPAPFVISFFGAVLCLFSLSAYASTPAATVVSLVGTVSAQMPDKTMRILCEGATLGAQETITTQKKSYIRLRFSDGGQITLRPQTSLRLDTYHYDEAKPAQDGIAFNLLKGGMRAISGLIGHRGNRDAYKAQAGVATIGIRGTRYGLLLCQDNCQGLLTGSTSADDAKQDPDKKPHASSLGNGLYLEVSAGEIVVSNDAGERDYHVGQYGYVGTLNALPALLPQDPGLDRALPATLDSGLSLGSLPGIGQEGACIAH